MVPEYAAGTLTPSVVEGVHVQALAAFVELAGIDHATWPSEDPIVILLDGAPDRVIDEPESYEDAPLVVGGAVTGMLRISCAAPLTKDQRGRYFGMAADLSKAIERLDAQRTQTKLARGAALVVRRRCQAWGSSSPASRTSSTTRSRASWLRAALAPEGSRGGRAPPGRDHLRRGRARLEDRVEPADLHAPAAGAEGLVEPQHAHRARAELRNYDLRVRNINTEMDPPDSALPETLIDPNQLQQVFLNILINAEQAMKGDDEGTLHIGTRASGRARSPCGSCRQRPRHDVTPRPLQHLRPVRHDEGGGRRHRPGPDDLLQHHRRAQGPSGPKASQTRLHVLRSSCRSSPGRRPPPRGAIPSPRRPPPPSESASSSSTTRTSIQRLLTGVLEMDGHEVIVAKNAAARRSTSSSAAVSTWSSPT